MSFTTYYNLEKFTYGTEEWNSAYSTNFDLIDTALNTISGSAASIPAHDELSGLGDDDHTQYVLADGSRGFSATVSGVDPVDSDDLATKNYVDTEITAVTASGISGWVDDGVNFRLTFTDGLITAVGTTISGGYSQI